MIAMTPLEQWIRRKAHISPWLQGSSFAKALSDYQLERVNETISYACRNSVFYRRHLPSRATAPLTALSDIDQLPFTTASDLARDPFRFLAVRQDDVARIVTLRTSGSTGQPKRLFFSDDDLELTVDFFHHGMSTIVRPGQKVAVLLPSEQTDSVGDLLIRGLRRMDVTALAYGPVRDPLHAIREVASFGADRQRLHTKRSPEYGLCPAGDRPDPGRGLGLPSIHSLWHDRDGPGRWRRV